MRYFCPSAVFDYLGGQMGDNKVFLADGIVNGHFHNIKRLDVSQHRFKVMANIIAQEGSSKDPEEYTFIANIARNEANAQGRSMWFANFWLFFCS